MRESDSFKTFEEFESRIEESMPKGDFMKLISYDPKKFLRRNPKDKTGITLAEHIKNLFKANGIGGQIKFFGNVPMGNKGHLIAISTEGSYVAMNPNNDIASKINRVGHTSYEDLLPIVAVGNLVNASDLI